MRVNEFLSVITVAGKELKNVCTCTHNKISVIFIRLVQVSVFSRTLLPLGYPHLVIAVVFRSTSQRRSYIHAKRMCVHI